MRKSFSKVLLLTVAAVMLLFSATPPAHAGSDKPETITVQGKIQAMKMQHLVVAGTEVNFSSAEFQRYDKKAIPSSSLEVGKRVMVIGQEKEDGRIIAQKIILLPSD